MVRWFKLTKNQYCGLFVLGFAFFAMQELPYIIMPFLALESNILMEMQDRSMLLNAIEKVIGVSCIVAMLFLVRTDAKWFSLKNRMERTCFTLAIAALAAYFIGWVFYFNGVQSLPLIFCILVAMPPIYYALIGLWRRNYALAVLGGLFLVAHLSNVWNNLRI